VPSLLPAVSAVCSIMNTMLFPDVMEYDMPYTASTIMDMLGLKSKETFRKNYMNPALEQNPVRMTISDKPNSRNQRDIRY